MGYFLDEDNNWALDMNEIQKSYDKGIAEGAEPRAIVVINPGNPTGNVLSKKNLEDVIKFAHKNKLFLFADEVYQVSLTFYYFSTKQASLVLIKSLTISIHKILALSITSLDSIAG